MIKNIFILFFLLTTINSIYSQNFKEISFSELQGSGSWSDPLIIGHASQPTVITNCPPLASGTYLDKSYIFRYFKITFQNTPSAQSAIGAVIGPTGNAISAVHPRLASAPGLTLLKSTANGFWVGNPDSDEVFGRYVSLNGLEANTYMLGVEKLDSPLRSVQTPPFTIVVIP